MLRKPAGRHLISIFLVTAFSAGAFATAAEFPGESPGKARGSAERGMLVLENDAIRVAWKTDGPSIKLWEIEDKLNGERLEPKAKAFQVLLHHSPNPAPVRLTTSDLHPVEGPHLQGIQRDAKSVRLADRFSGHQFTATWATSDGLLNVEWRALLRDDSNYVTQKVTLTAQSEPVEIEDLVLFDLAASEARVVGTVSGSPIVAGHMFFAYEHPMSMCRTVEGGAGPGAVPFRCSYPNGIPLMAEESVTHSSVIGVVPENQLRRGFLYYVERERAQPYFTFLQHNNGEDIGLGYCRLEKSDADAAARYRLRQHEMWLDIIHTYGKELIRSRDVRMDSFVHDFKWDDVKRVWQFHGGYPEGFEPMERAAESYGAGLGVWLTPWGRTGDPKRAEYGIQKGFEGDSRGGSARFLSLAGPRYFLRFRSACVNMLRDYDVNYFKFDGIAGGNGADGPNKYPSEIEALLKVIAELRTIKPRVFVNASTGSWPSPFWLWHGDSIWRNGGDAGEVGKGSLRQQWITYRDKSTYEMTVQRGPLYPINSLMLHGIMVNSGERVRSYETKDIIDEIRSFFGTGTNLQELYINSGLMNDQTWDTLAEAARWSRANADVLVDTHWVGGDPAKHEVYGWASWTARKGILTLRNPDDRRKSIPVDIGAYFELPEGAARSYTVKSPWKDDAGKPAVKVTAGVAHSFALAPFEVLVLEATPQ